jgi:micrococcal nuclease
MIKAFLALALAPTLVFAHSGGMDSRGGHHCRTDCEQKGYNMGQYHFHPNLMDTKQFKSYSRLRGALCTRVMRRFSDNPTMLNRVQDRVEGRFGFRCGQEIIDSTAPKTGYDLIKVRRRAEGTQVIRVLDGDTIEVRESDGDEEKVRFIGIDAPEASGFGNKAECYGKEASLYLKRLLSSKHVELIPQPTDDRDKYRRLLRYVHMSGGDVGLRMLTLGYARYYPWFEHPRMEEYRNTAREAQNAKRGLWGKCE